MPGNDVDSGIGNLYELDNSLQEQNCSQLFGGNWQALDQSPWVGTPSRAPLNFNLKNYSLQQQLDTLKGHCGESFSVPLDQTYAQVTVRPDFSRGLSVNNQLNKDDLLLGCQNFLSKQNHSGSFGVNTCYDQHGLTSKGFTIFKPQYENECADSPTLTTNSERSEITEASSDLNLFRGQQHLLRDQQLDTSLSYTMQQSGYNDMQLLQQHMMYKQLQELQRQQQFQQLGDVRQQNSLNQISAIGKQAGSNQFSTLINGTPVHDAPQLLRNWMQRGPSATQGVSNKVMFSQEQIHGLCNMGLAAQQNDMSLYGTPIANARGNMSQYPQIQGISNEPVNLLPKIIGQAQKSMMQSPGFSSHFFVDQSNVSSDLVGLPQGSLVSKQGFLVKDNIGQAPMQGLNTGAFPGNLQESSSAQVNTSAKEFKGGQEQVGWSSMQQSTKQLGSQTLVPLDPMEAKILYNMDGNIWDAFGGRPDMGSEGFGNIMEQPDSSNAITSLQSGSWSALMQSAVAEASSSDTGLQEEWSGLTFQNTEHSTDNQLSNFMESDNKQTGWVDSNLQSASSFTSKSFPMTTDTGINSSFPGFPQPDAKLSFEQRKDVFQDGTDESFENYDRQQKQSVEEGQKVQTFMHSGSSWAGQMFDHSKANTQLDRVVKNDVSMENKGNEDISKVHHQMTNRPFVVHNYSEGANQTYGKQQNFCQKENSSELYTCEGLNGHGQGQFEHYKSTLSGFHGTSSASEDVPSRDDHGSNATTGFHGSVPCDSSNLPDQISKNMLELLHKVDQSKDDKTITQPDHNSFPKAPGVDCRDTSVTQVYNQPSASQGFGLRLAPPSQRLPNSNNLFSPQALPQASNLNSRLVNPELDDRNQVWAASSPSHQALHLAPSNELSERANWDNRPSNLGNSGFLNALGNSVASLTPNPSYARNQHQTSTSNVPTLSQAFKPASLGSVGKYSPFNQTPSQDALQQISTNQRQQFPVLEASPVSQPSTMSHISQQGEASPRPHNVWRNVSTQRQPIPLDPPKFPSTVPSLDLSSNNIVGTSLAPHGLHDRNSVKTGYRSAEFGAPSGSQGFDYGEHPRKDMQQQTSSKMHDASHSNDASQGQEPVADKTAHRSSSLASHYEQRDLDKVGHDNNVASASSNRNPEVNSHSDNHHKNYPTLDQGHAMNNHIDGDLAVQQVTALKGQQLHGGSAIFRYPRDGGLNSVLHPNSIPSGDNKLLCFIAEARDDASAKSSLQSALQASQEVVPFGHSDSQAQSSSSNVLLKNSDHGQVNLQMAPSWFKQYGTLKNGQMVPIFDPRFSKTAAAQFSIGQPQILNAAADIGQAGKVWTDVVANQHLPGPCMLPSEATTQDAITRSRKRKIASYERLSWHKEVTQDSKRLQNISMAEEEWAHAINRLIEKVENYEMIDDMQPVLRAKRRIVLTKQLMQQLIRPAQASIFCADFTSSYDFLPYYISRLSIGDACSLANCRNGSLTCANNSNMNSEKPNIFEGGGDQQTPEVVKEFISRAQKLEQEFYRLDKKASLVDVRVEFQELERFSVINRFARFHVRGQPDSSGTSSTSAPKLIPDRYVMAFPMPRNLPEGAQCLSL